MAAESFGIDAFILWQRIWAERLPQGFFRYYMVVDASSYRNLLESSGQCHTGFKKTFSISLSLPPLSLSLSLSCFLLSFHNFLFCFLLLIRHFIFCEEISLKKSYLMRGLNPGILRDR
jgi:hypothetical protein